MEIVLRLRALPRIAPWAHEHAAILKAETPQAEYNRVDDQAFMRHTDVFAVPRTSVEKSGGAKTMSAASVPSLTAALRLTHVPIPLATLNRPGHDRDDDGVFFCDC